MKFLYRTFLLHALFFLSLFTGCAKNPVTGKQELHLISKNYEVNVGKTHYLPLQQIEGGVYVSDPELITYVSTVGKKIASVSDRPNLPYEFVIIDSEIPNAWALPGGKIAINRALLLELNSEAELAAVLSHEIVHAAARHGAQAMERGMVIEGALKGITLATLDSRHQNGVLGVANLASFLINQKYGRQAELEADKYGMRYMSRAGYDPQAALTLQQTFLRLSKEKNPNWLHGLFASHPPSKERILAIQQTLLKYPRGGYTGKRAYQKQIAHLKKTKQAYSYLVKGEEELADQRLTEALLYANNAIAIDPSESKFYTLKGMALTKLGHTKEALKAYNKAIEINKSYYKNYLHRALLLHQTDENTQALKDFKKSTSLLPTSLAYLEIGEIYHTQGNTPKAIHSFQIAAQDTQTTTGQKAREWLDDLQKKK